MCGVPKGVRLAMTDRRVVCVHLGFEAMGKVTQEKTRKRRGLGMEPRGLERWQGGSGVKGD